MLGRTNITVLAEGGTVTEIEDYRWLQVQSDIRGNFVKAICQGGFLAAITASGDIACTVDGEAWTASRPDYVDCELCDIEWDGDRFLIAGSCTENGKKVGLVLSTRDFVQYERLTIRHDDDEDDCYVERYCGIYSVNGKFLVVSVRNNAGRIIPYVYAGGLDDVMENRACLLYASDKFAEALSIAKNSDGMLVCVNRRDNIDKPLDTVSWVGHDGRNVFICTMESKKGLMQANVFEGKDALFYESKVASANYKLVKVLPSCEEMTLCIGQNFAFVDGAYFGGSQLFINSHEMLIVKKGESIADKTVDDLIEIAPEMTMRCIAKAFGQLYVFGNHGAILKSSMETGNEAGIAVQAMSAKKALADAKAYTDARYTELEERIAALEALGMAEG